MSFVWQNWKIYSIILLFPCSFVKKKKKKKKKTEVEEKYLRIPYCLASETEWFISFIYFFFQPLLLYHADGKFTTHDLSLLPRGHHCRIYVLAKVCISRTWRLLPLAYTLYREWDRSVGGFSDSWWTVIYIEHTRILF